MMMTNGLYCIQYMRFGGMNDMFGPKGICEDCSAALPEWKWNDRDRREVCSLCRIARVIEEDARAMRGEY